MLSRAFSFPIVRHFETFMQTSPVYQILATLKKKRALFTSTTVFAVPWLVTQSSFPRLRDNSQKTAVRNSLAAVFGMSRNVPRDIPENVAKVERLPVAY